MIYDIINTNHLIIERDFNMEELVEFVLEVIIGIFEASYDGVGKTSKDRFNEEKLDVTKNQESYIAGIIATTIALSYHDDHKLDRHEKKMIRDLLKKYRDILTKKTRKNIKYIKKQKLSLGHLKVLYNKLNIDRYTIVKITRDLERILKHIEKDTTKQIQFLRDLHKEYNPDYHYHLA